MEAETYLKQIEECQYRIENATEEIQRLEALANDISPHLSKVKVQTTPDPQKAQKVWVRLIAAKDSLLDEVDELLDLKTEVTTTLKLLPAEQYDVLYKLYVLQQPVQTVADKKHYTRQAIYYIKDQGIEKLQKILDSR